jgi:uncharacterized protein YbjT (DUF2867 family)
MNSDPISAIYPASDISRRAFTRGLMSSVAILRVPRRKIDRLLKKSDCLSQIDPPYRLTGGEDSKSVFLYLIERQIMKIVVIGETGLSGSKTVASLRQGGHEVVAGSPQSGINSITGEGLQEAMAGAQVVIDLANAPSWEDQAVLEFFQTSSRNVLAAEAAAGVRHHVALSIVGTDRMPDNGYFRAKVAQEKLIETSGIPYTIIRSTQFMEFLGGIAASNTDGNIVRLSPGLFQPIASDDVAAIVADVALPAPRSGIVEIAGPERAPLNEIIARYLKAVGDPREVVSDPEARYFGGRVEEHSLVPLGEARLGRIGLDEWVRRSQAVA